MCFFHGIEAWACLVGFRQQRWEIQQEDEDVPVIGRGEPSWCLRLSWPFGCSQVWSPGWGGKLPACTFNGDYAWTHYRMICKPTSIFWDGSDWDAHWLMLSYLFVSVFFQCLPWFIFLHASIMWFLHLLGWDLSLAHGQAMRFKSWNSWPVGCDEKNLAGCISGSFRSLTSLVPPGMNPERWRFQLLAIHAADRFWSVHDDLVRLLLKIWRAAGSWSEVKRT